MVGVIAEAASLKPHLDLARKAMSDAAAQLRESRREVAAASAVAAGEELKNARKLAADLAAKAQYLAEMTANLEQLRPMPRTCSSADRPAGEDRVGRACRVRLYHGRAGRVAGRSDGAVGSGRAHRGRCISDGGQGNGAGPRELKQVHREQAVVHQILAERRSASASMSCRSTLAALLEALGAKHPDGGRSRQGQPVVPRALSGDPGKRPLRRNPPSGLETALPPLAPKQIDLKKEAVEVSESPGWTRPPGSSHLAKAVEHIKVAIDEMDKVTGSLEKSSRQPAVDREQAAEKYLRMVFADVVLTMFEPAEEELLNKPMKLIRIKSSSTAYEHWALFEKTDPGGAGRQSRPAERGSLTDRDRAALNENFARELPLEYRQLLKTTMKPLRNETASAMHKNIRLLLLGAAWMTIGFWPGVRQLRTAAGLTGCRGRSSRRRSRRQRGQRDSVGGPAPAEILHQNDIGDLLDRRTEAAIKRGLAYLKAASGRTGPGGRRRYQLHRLYGLVDDRLHAQRLFSLGETALRPDAQAGLDYLVPKRQAGHHAATWAPICTRMAWRPWRFPRPGDRPIGTTKSRRPEGGRGRHSSQPGGPIGGWRRTPVPGDAERFRHRHAVGGPFRRPAGRHPRAQPDHRPGDSLHPPCRRPADRRLRLRGRRGLAGPASLGGGGLFADDVRPARLGGSQSGHPLPRIAARREVQQLQLLRLRPLLRGAGHVDGRRGPFSRLVSQIRNVLLRIRPKSGSWADRPYETSMALIVLSIPYCYVPAYQR